MNNEPSKKHKKQADGYLIVPESRTSPLEIISGKAAIKAIKRIANYDVHIRFVYISRSLRLQFAPYAGELSYDGDFELQRNEFFEDWHMEKYDIYGPVIVSGPIDEIIAIEADNTALWKVLDLHVKMVWIPSPYFLRDISEQLLENAQLPHGSSL